MKINEIIRLNSIYGVIENSKISFKTAYKFAKLKEEIEKALNFYQEQMNKLIDEYAQKDENGKCVMAEGGRDVLIIEGKERECHEKINELENCEIDVSGISFDLAELEPIQLTVSEITSLMPLIKE